MRKCEEAVLLLKKLYPAYRRHDIGHVCRVLLLAHMIAGEFEMDDADQAALALCAIYYEHGADGLIDMAA